MGARSTGAGGLRQGQPPPHMLLLTAQHEHLQSPVDGERGLVADVIAYSKKGASLSASVWAELARVLAPRSSWRGSGLDGAPAGGQKQEAPGKLKYAAASAATGCSGARRPAGGGTKRTCSATAGNARCLRKRGIITARAAQRGGRLLAGWRPRRRSVLDFLEQRHLVVVAAVSVRMLVLSIGAPALRMQAARGRSRQEGAVLSLARFS